MSGIFGYLSLDDNDRSFISTLGQAVVFDATQKFLADYNAEQAWQLRAFVEMTTENYTERYKLPGGGYLQRMSGVTQSGAVKAYGSWDVSYPLEPFGAQIAGDNRSLAYMTIEEYNRHLQTIMIQDANTIRFEILRRLLDNVADTFVDPIWGSLTIQPLANGDAVVYPPVIGSGTEAIEDHYLESGYASTSVTDTNNPYSTVRDDLEHHFGKVTGGQNIICYINSAQRGVTEDLTDFYEVPDAYIRPGQDTDVPYGYPDVPPTAQVLGRCSGVWVVEWNWIPANYIVAIHGDAPKPLKMRVDPGYTGLPQGLALVSEDATYPLKESHWEHTFGVGVGNRLNGVVMELGTGGTYTIPTGYS